MSRHSAWRAGGITRFYTEAATLAEAQQLARMAETNRLPLVWLGRGTNVLVRDAGFPGLIVGYRAEGWQLDEQGNTALVRVAAGTAMAGLARHLSAKGWAGLAWAEGLPGTVGGAVVGNAGCYGGEIANLLASAEILVGTTVETWPTQRLAYGYRTSALKVGDGDQGSGVRDQGSGIGDQESGIGSQGATPIPDPRSPIPHPPSPIPRSPPIPHPRSPIPWLPPIPCPPTPIPRSPSIPDPPTPIPWPPPRRTASAYRVWMRCCPIARLAKRKASAAWGLASKRAMPTAIRARAVRQCSSVSRATST